MTPFLQLRLWLRRAAVSERLTVAAVAALVLSLAVWAALPVGSSPGSTLSSSPSSPDGATPSSPTGQPAAAGTTGRVSPPGTTGGTTTGGLPATRGAGSATTGGIGTTGGVTGGSPVPGRVPSPVTSSTCGPTGSSDQGVTTSTVRIDVTLANLQGQAGNSLAGIPSAEVQQQMFEAALADLNKRGGVKCRKVVAKYYKVNPLDQSSLQQVCLDIVADKPFSLLDVGLSSPIGSTTPRNCPPKNKIPSFGSASMGQSELSTYGPYQFSYYPVAERTVHNAIKGLAQLGWFKDAKVVGLLEQQCIPNLNTIARRDLKALGFADKKLSAFDFGCTNGIPSPSDTAAAVLQFQRAGVTHVFDDGGVYANFFSQQAAKQGFRPKYGLGDQATIALFSQPGLGPDANNFAGGLVITGTRYGEERTAGQKRSALTLRCDAAMRARGLPGSWESPNGFSGVACSQVAMFANAANSSPGLRRNELAGALRALGKADLPYPAGPADFTTTGGQNGGGYWRPTVFVKDCRCFRLYRSTFTADFR